MSKISNDFAENLEKEGFVKYSPGPDDQIMVKGDADLVVTQNLKTPHQYDIAAYIFSAISNTPSDKVYFSYQEMENFILSHSPTKQNHLIEDTKVVLSILEKLRIGVAEKPLLLNNAKFDTDAGIIAMTINPASTFIFGPTLSRQRQQ